MVFSEEIAYLIGELQNIGGSEDIIKRLKNKEYSAYSEALLAVYFINRDFEIRLEPSSVDGRKNDIAVKVNSKWINIEVKTPQQSDLQKEIEKGNQELFQIASKIPVPRNIHIFLTKEPTITEQKEITKKTLRLALNEQQPSSGEVNNIAYIKTEKQAEPIVTKTETLMPLTIAPPPPESIRSIYDGIPKLFLSGTNFGKNGLTVNLSINIPFEDNRIISMINKKRRQLDRNLMNMVAFDTTKIPIWPTAGKQKWISRLKEAFKKEISGRIGAVLLFSHTRNKENIILRSSLFVHQNPYRKIPLKFLNKCDLNSFALVKKTLLKDD